MIEARGLTKDYGDKRAVDDLSFTVRPGIVTGFLGPNGSGKSTTMRLILGLDRPTAGDVIVNGKHYREHAAPLHEVGALLEARSVHTGRSAYNHLLALAQTHGIPRSRVDAGEAAARPAFGARRHLRRARARAAGGARPAGGEDRRHGGCQPARAARADAAAGLARGGLHGADTRGHRVQGAAGRVRADD